MSTQKCLYKASVGASVFIGAGSAFLFIVAALAAMNNDRGLVINHVLKFETTGATRLFWAIAVLFAFGLVWLLWTILIGSYQDQFIVLGDKTITVPVVLGTGDPIVVRFVHIKNISQLTDQRTKYRRLRIQHAHGHIEIQESVLNSAPLFNRLRVALIERVETAKNAAVTAAP